MTTENDLILSAIADGHYNLQGIAEAVGLEVKTTSNRLYLLKQKGQIARRPEDGWMLTDGAAPAGRVHRIAEDGEDRPAPKRARQKARRSRTASRSKPRAAAQPAVDMHDVHTPAVPAPTARELEFAVSESGAVLFKTLKSGELGEINCADALALYRLMSAVEFITENA